MSKWDIAGVVAGAGLLAYGMYRLFSKWSDFNQYYKSI